MAQILVIDDDSSLLTMMSMILKRAGHETLTATNGQDGINVAREQRPDLAFVDVMMPEMNGLQVCQYLRQDASTSHIPLVVLTALTGKEHEEDALAAGADRYLSKPVTFDSLAEIINELL